MMVRIRQAESGDAMGAAYFWTPLGAIITGYPGG